MLIGIAATAAAVSQDGNNTNQGANATAQPTGTHLIKCGDMDHWVTRHVKESSIIGGNMKTLQEIAPTKTWAQNAPYTNWGGSPWGTSNVMAKVSGITYIQAPCRKNGELFVFLAVFV